MVLPCVVIDMSFPKRFLCFVVAACVSFCSTIAPAYAVVSYPGLPTINAIIRGTVGTYVDTSTGVNITRSAIALADGVSIPFTVAETATSAEVSAGVVAAALANPYGAAAAAVIAAAIIYGWYKCSIASSGWCKNQPSQVSADAGYFWVATGQGSTQYASPSAACAATGYPIPVTSTPTSYYCENSGGYLTGNVASRVTGSCQPGFSKQADGSCQSTTMIVVPQATDPVHSPDAQGTTARAITDHNQTASADAKAAEADGHPIDDPRVNPQLPTTVSSSPTSASPTTKSEPHSDGTVTETTCTTSYTLGKSSGDNSSAAITQSTTQNCSASTVLTDGTRTTPLTTTTTTGSQQDPSHGPVECGSPGKPKCAIDETDTPTSTGQEFAVPKTAVQKTQDDATTAITAVPTTSRDTAWKFSFSLPSGCTPYTMFLDVVVDYCRFQPIIHDLMSMIWYGTTFFTVVGMFGRAARNA